MNTGNSTKTVWVETRTHRCTEMEGYIPPNTGNYRDATNSVPAFSMYAGTPRSASDDRFRGAVWRVLSVALVAVWATVAWVFAR